MALPLALTLGEPAGIGPDITFAAWRRRAELGLTPFYILADPVFLRGCAERIAPDVPVAVVEPSAAVAAFAQALPVVDIGVTITAKPGHPDDSSAPAAIAAIRRAVHDVHSGRARAVVTNPVAKAILYRSGFAEPGHTEYLAKLAAEMMGITAQPVMMLWSPELAVVPVTIHLPLREVMTRLTTELISSTGEIVALKKLKLEREADGFPITSLREIQTLMVSKHPNVVNLREVVVGDALNQCVFQQELPLTFQRPFFFFLDRCDIITRHPKWQWKWSFLSLDTRIIL